MLESVFLYRGFVVPKLSEVLKKGFDIHNPKWHFMGDNNWPGGLSLGRNDAFGLAEEISREFSGIPVGGRISITEELLQEIKLTGIRRILDSSGGITEGSLDYWRCMNWEDVNKAWEFAVEGKYLTPTWLKKMEGAVCIKNGIYQPYDEFRSSIEGGKSVFEGIFRG